MTFKLSNSPFLKLIAAMICVPYLVSCGYFESRDLASVYDLDEAPTEESIILDHSKSAETYESSEELLAQKAAPSTKSSITKLQLVNASTGLVIRDLVNGSTIDLDQEGTDLTIQAVVVGSVESVKFALDGVNSIDNVPPYSLAGNDNFGNYNIAKLIVGSHTLAATPFAADYASGTRGSSLKLSFSVVQPSAVVAPAPAPSPTPPPNEDYQADVVAAAQAEADLALCGTDATTRYVAVAGSAWCSEFARWVFIQAGIMVDSTSALWSIDSWNDFQTFYTNKGKFLSRSQIKPTSEYVTSMIGNYLLLDTNLDGVANHSAIIVGVSEDLTKLYTVEGNVSNCTKRVTRSFWVNGVLDAKIQGIGIIWP